MSIMMTLQLPSEPENILNVTAPPPRASFPPKPASPCPQPTGQAQGSLVLESELGLCRATGSVSTETCLEMSVVMVLKPSP